MTDPQPRSALQALRAYGDEEKANSIKAKDRDTHQFWAGWLSALDRVEAVLASWPPAPPEPTKRWSLTTSDGVTAMRPDLNGQWVRLHDVASALTPARPPTAEPEKTDGNS